MFFGHIHVKAEKNMQKQAKDTTIQENILLYTIKMKWNFEAREKRVCHKR